MIAVIAWTLVAVALTGSAVALAGTLSDARAHSTGRDVRGESSPPLTSVGLVLSVMALAGLGVLWLVTSR